MKIILFLIALLFSLSLKAQEATLDSIVLQSYIEFMRDVKAPIRLDRTTHKRNLWKDNIGTNPRTISWYESTMQELEKEHDTTLNLLSQLQDSVLMKEMTKREVEFRLLVSKDKKLQRKYGKLWNDLDKIFEERKQLESRLQFYTAGGLHLLDIGIHMVRASDPSEISEKREFAVLELERYSKSYLGYPVQDNHLRRLLFKDHLETAANWLEPTDPYFTQVLDGASGEEFLTRVYGSGLRNTTASKIIHEEHRELLLNQGWEVMRLSNDPVIVAARQLVTLIRENENLTEELNKKENEILNKINEAFYKVNGVIVTFYGNHYDRVYNYDLNYDHLVQIE